jgi:hypothetical protein
VKSQTSYDLDEDEITIVDEIHYGVNVDVKEEDHVDQWVNERRQDLRLKEDVSLDEEIPFEERARLKEEPSSTVSS